MNTLNFNGKVYELIEVPHDRFVVYDTENKYEDIGDTDIQGDDPFRYYCRSLNIKGKFYALKLLKNKSDDNIR